MKNIKQAKCVCVCVCVCVKTEKWTKTQEDTVWKGKDHNLKKVAAMYKPQYYR